MVITAGGFKDIWKEEVAPDGTMLNIGPYKLGKDYFNVLHHQDSKWRWSSSEPSRIPRGTPRSTDANNGTVVFTDENGDPHVFSIRKCPGLLNHLRENGWSSDYHGTPYSNDSGASMHRMYQNGFLQKFGLNSWPISRFLQIIDKVNPKILDQVENKIGFSILDIREVASDYNSASFVGELVLDNLKRVILKVVDKEKHHTACIDNRILNNGANHEKLSGLFAAPITSVLQEGDNYFDIREHADDLSSGHKSSGFLDPVLHAVYVAAMFHTWGNELSDGVEFDKTNPYKTMEILQDYIERAKNTHPENNLPMSRSEFGWLMGFNSDRIAKILEGQGDHYLTHRDLRIENLPNGRLVDCGSVCFFPEPAVDLSEILLHNFGIDLYEDDTAEYYLNWYNLIRTKCFREKYDLDSEVKNVIEFIDLKSVYTGLVLEGVQWGAYDARDRAEDKKVSEYLEVARIAAERIYGMN